MFFLDQKCLNTANSTERREVPTCCNNIISGYKTIGKITFNSSITSALHCTDIRSKKQRSEMEKVAQHDEIKAVSLMVD